MTPCIEEARRLLRLAERDYRTFLILRGHPNAELEPTCFHAQQAAEKALKAALIARSTDFRRTHDLEELANLLADLGVALPFTSREFRRLNPFAVELRYGDGGAVLITPEEAERMVRETLAWTSEFIVERQSQT